MSTILGATFLVALLVGIVWLFWIGAEPYIKIIKGDKPKPETCTAKEEMEHYQTLLDEWEPVEGSPLHESLVDAIADAQVRADAAKSEQEWRAHIKASEDVLFDANLRFLTSHNTRRIQQERERAERLRCELDELKARRDKARQYLADSRRAV